MMTDRPLSAMVVNILQLELNALGAWKYQWSPGITLNERPLEGVAYCSTNPLIAVAR